MQMYIQLVFGSNTKHKHETSIEIILYDESQAILILNNSIWQSVSVMQLGVKIILLSFISVAFCWVHYI